MTRVCGECQADCAKIVRGRCRPCYRRLVLALKKQGRFEPIEPTAAARRIPRPVRDRLLEKVVAGPGGCWIFTGNLNNMGYGRFRTSGDSTTSCGFAHRASYELFVGPIPAGASVDHTCHNRDGSCTSGGPCLHRRCINPAHLEPVSHATNILRSRITVASRNANKTHCVNGHELTEENTARPLDKATQRRYRRCRVCIREQRRATADRQRARRLSADQKEKSVSQP